MALTSKFSYQRLKHENGMYDEVRDKDKDRRVINDFVRRRRWSSLRKVRIKIKKVKIRVPWLLRRKAYKGLMCSWDKVLKRLKESQAHFGDIFGGNYLFLQVNPTPYKLKNLQSSPSFRQ